MALEKLSIPPATTTGGREGKSQTDDGKLAVTLAPPRDGRQRQRHQPEQLFAVGYSACFMGAVKFVAGTQSAGGRLDQRRRGHRPDPRLRHPGGVRISIPGWPKADVQALVDAAHKVALLERRAAAST